MDRLATHYMLEEGEWSWKEAAKQQADALSTVSTDAFEIQAPKQAIHGLKWFNYMVMSPYCHEVSQPPRCDSSHHLHCPEGYVFGIRTRW